MRKLIKNSQDTFRVKAYAGTNGVLLAFDLNETRKPGFLGFAIEQKENNKPWQWLLNSLTFPGKAHTVPKWGATPSNIAPIQKFRWADYSIAAGATCKYRVHLVHAGQQGLGEALEVEVTTDDGKPENHRVHFNRAVAASQSFGRKFAALDELLSDDPDKPIEKWPAAPRNWLENGLLDAIQRFILRAKGKKWALDLAIYEYELKAIVDEINKAHGRGVNVRVLYHARKDDEQTPQNIASLRKIPKERKRGRVTSKIFHDKFIVLSQINSAGERVPQAVLCGSTNFTENGVYRQANVIHVVDGEAIASRYLELFDTIWSSPEEVTFVRAWINANNPIDTQSNVFVGFSPRSERADLDQFINEVRAADKDLLFATAFELPDDVLDALLGTANDPVLRYGIQNTASRITGFHADRTAEFTATALLNNGLERWVKEGLRGQRGNLLIHTKAVITNFTSDNPVIISGSHNLSLAASKYNDENFLIMRGDTDLADRYGLELLRFYEHYRFRYYAKKLKLREVRPLSPDDSWADDYYRSGHLKKSARLLFAGRAN
jgi:phosphatidylserine/phosphatidylglycerophosphate/cardiolipin synthase-like enzyme